MQLGTLQPTLIIEHIIGLWIKKAFEATYL